MGLVFCGEESSDGATGQMPPGLAEWLGFSQIPLVVTPVELDPLRRMVRGRWERRDGYEMLEVPLPGVISVKMGCNEPRFMDYTCKPWAFAPERVTVWGAKDLEVGGSRVGLAGSPTQTVDSLLAGRWEVFRDALRHLVLPASVLGAYSMGLIPRSSMVGVLAQDYIRVARAKGLREWVVIGRHALRNAAIPPVTAIGLAFGNLMAGAVMTETVFAWPGIGRYAVDAASKLDFPPVMGVTLLVAGIYIAINLVVDISYALLDPRVRLQ